MLILGLEVGLFVVQENRKEPRFIKKSRVNLNPL